MYLNTLEKNEMYKSVSEIVGTDIEVVKKFIKEKYRNRDFAFKKKESHFANILWDKTGKIPTG